MPSVWLDTSLSNAIAMHAGVLAGAIDYYISAPLQRAKTKAFGKVRIESSLNCQTSDAVSLEWLIVPMRIETPEWSMPTAHHGTIWAQSGMTHSRSTEHVLNTAAALSSHRRTSGWARSSPRGALARCSAASCWTSTRRRRSPSSSRRCCPWYFVTSLVVRQHPASCTQGCDTAHTAAQTPPSSPPASM